MRLEPAASRRLLNTSSKPNNKTNLVYTMEELTIGEMASLSGGLDPRVDRCSGIGSGLSGPGGGPHRTMGGGLDGANFLAVVKQLAGD